jgi:hypothetical protein
LADIPNEFDGIKSKKETIDDDEGVFDRLLKKMEGM